MTKKNCWMCESASENIIEIESPLYFQCPNCDLIFIEDDFILDDQQEKKRYTLHQNNYGNVGYVEMLKQFIGVAVKPFNIRIKRGLDFGCGPVPVLSDLISEDGNQMDIYDPCFYNDLSFHRKKYDLITATEVFEHLKSPGYTIPLLEKLLNNGGLLSIMTLFHGNCDFKNWWYRQDRTHICFYSHKTCHWIARRFLLNIVYINNKNICVWQKPDKM